MNRIFYIYLLFLGCQSSEFQPFNGKKRFFGETSLRGAQFFSFEPEAAVFQPEQPNLFEDSTVFNYSREAKLVIHHQSFVMTDSLIISLYSKTQNKWILEQEQALFTDALMYLSPVFKDFNEDGQDDLTVVTSSAARASNEVRTLILLDPKKPKFRVVPNSEHYPNLDYNPQTNCITSVAYHAGTTTHFLELQNDSLVPVAAVDLVDGYMKSEVIKSDEWITIACDSNYKADYVRFCNYDPVIICDP